MTDVFGGPFGGYTTPANAISAAAQTELLAELDKLRALIARTEGQSQPHPDFDLIHPETANKLVAEIDALKTAIDATATA